MNRDGYDDFLVGAGGNDAGGSDAGRAYLFFGSGPNVRPQLRSVADVPSDQGGQVTLRWARSGYDQQSGGRVTGYVVERSLPPGTTGLAWEEIVANLRLLFDSPHLPEPTCLSPHWRCRPFPERLFREAEINGEKSTSRGCKTTRTPTKGIMQENPISATCG